MTIDDYKLTIFLLIGLFFVFGCDNAPNENCTSVGRPARIRPDYRDTVIPPNIAPLNFTVEEPGSRYFVRIYSDQGNPIEISSRTSRIFIPQDSWRTLLDANRGRQFSIDVFVKQAASASSPDVRSFPWQRFSTVMAKIANEDIDAFLVYRKIRPGHRLWRDMGIYQRNLQQFDESLVLDNGYFKQGCLNCHTFCGNRTDKMLIGIRSVDYGNSALLVEDGRVSKIGTKFGYTSWHPSGKVAAFSVNDVRLFLHSSASEIRDVMDFDSFLAYYLVDTKVAKTSPDIARKDRLETYPAWSPDGQYLYFCSAERPSSDSAAIPSTEFTLSAVEGLGTSFENYSQIKYDLVRISYDLAHDRWGQAETVLSGAATGLSILLPRVSPDGRWLLFCMCNYGCFPVYQHSSDLYMIDLADARETGQYKYRRLQINSDQSESWHSWSKNSRWIAFSSKRQSGAFTRIYISYVDADGRVYKPIVLPQRDPACYDWCLWTYSLPEFVTEPVRAAKEKLGRVVRSSGHVSIEMPITAATPKVLPPGPKDQLPRLGSGQAWMGERE